MQKSNALIVKNILSLPRYAKRVVALGVDISLCVISVWIAYYLRLGEFVNLSLGAFWASVASIIIALPIFVVFGFYRAIFRYTGWSAFSSVAKAVGLYAFFYATIFTVIGTQDVPRTLGLIQPIILLLTVGASRGLARYWLGGRYHYQLKQSLIPNVLIYGAGKAGRQLAAVMANSYEMNVVGFLDDDLRLQGQLLNSQPIYDPANLAELVDSLDVSHVLLALPSASRSRRNEIIHQMRDVNVAVRTLPSLIELAQGKISFSDLKDLDIDDLLGRESVEPNKKLLIKNITKKVVMVTGAGGSIGGELCRQIIKQNPEILLLIDISEYALYNIHQELIALIDNQEIRLVPLLASVCDEQRINEILKSWKPDTVYHAAAYKHVPLVEHNPAEGIKNNVFGTLNFVLLAINNNVSDFVLISTDKAVRPTNIMGASKRLAEMILQALSAQGSDTKLSMVRFGNVLGSSGSVVPRFRQQIREGGPITLTHPEITRYFMTIPEAAELVIQAGAMAKGGDVFVLDMGTSVKIIDLAHKMVELAGLKIKNEYEPKGDIEIKITGLRPGEKLYEELLIGENPQVTNHPRIMTAHENFIIWDELKSLLLELKAILNDNRVDEIPDFLKKVVTGYAFGGDVVDFVYLQIVLNNRKLN